VGLVADSVGMRLQLVYRMMEYLVCPAQFPSKERP